jgi:hypothetical protein
MDVLYAMDVSKKAENKIKRLEFTHCLTQQLATSRYEQKFLLMSWSHCQNHDLKKQKSFTEKILHFQDKQIKNISI